MTFQDIKKKTGKLNRCQQASANYSLAWKNESAKLLNESISDDSFKEAVKWCGIGGYVIRTVSTEKRPAFLEYMVGIRTGIIEGKYSFENIPEYGGKRPISWISKVCHIMNPQAYPIIYDENARKALDIKCFKQFYNELVSIRESVSSKSKEEIYRMESELWASKLKWRMI